MTAGRVRGGHGLAIVGIAIALLLVCASVARAAAPVNDDFASAQVIGPSLPIAVSGSNTEATKQAEEPDHAGGAGGHSVWYSWTPAASGPVALQVTSCFASLHAPLVAVYTGSAVNALTPVAAKAMPNASNCFFSEPEQLEFSVSAGTTYRIAIDGREGQQGSFNLNVNPPPANDDFAAAEAIPAVPPQVIHGTTRMATKQAEEPDHAGDPGGHSVWYTWTAPANMPVRISACGEFSPLDSVLAVYTGSAVNALVPVAGNDDTPAAEFSPFCGETGSEVEFEATSGTTYRIAVDGADETAGRFRLTLTSRPENDDFEHPQTLSGSLPIYTSDFTNVLATKQSGEPDHAGDPGGHSVWFKWTPASSGPVDISACGSAGLDPLLGVYTGGEVASLTPVAAAVPVQGCATGSEAVFNATAGTEYRIGVDGRNGTEGKLALKLEAPPANDAFANAKAIGPGLPAFASGSTRMASKEVGEPDHAGDPGGHSVWYSWTPESSGAVTLDVCGYSEEDAEGLVAVYTGPALNALTPLVSDSDPVSPCYSSAAAEIPITAVAGTTYWIAIDSAGTRNFNFSFEVTGAPANDDFANAQALSPEPMTAGGKTRFATKETGEPNHAGDPGGHSLWYSWTPSSSGPVDITACGRSAGLDTLLAVYTGSAVNALTPVAANDDTATEPPNELCEWNTHDSEVVFNAVAGTTYRIAVDSKGGVGRFGLAFERAPSNDDFATPRVIEGRLPGFGSVFNKLANKQVGEPNHAGDAGGHSLWYSWTPESSGPVSISTCSHYGPIDTLLAVYTGSELPGLTPVASDDEGGVAGCRATDSAVQFSAVAGTTYRIAVDGKGGSWGGTQLSIEGPAANDEFGHPYALGAHLPTSYSFTSNLFATKQVGEPSHAGDPGGASVWFKWTAPRTGPVSVDTCGSGFDTLLGVYKGTAVGSLSEVAANDDGSGKCAPQSKLTFGAVANTAYRIAVDGKGGVQGPVELHIDGPPGNDDFEHATVIPGSAGWYWPGSTMLATKQSGEPNHAGDPGGASVWYSWTPAKTAAVELDACSKTFDPLLGLYTGASLEHLTAVATADAGLGECEGGHSLGFKAVAGTTYRIAVDGAGADSGHFELHLRKVAARRALAVATAGGGAGSVTSSPAGIDCGSICSHDFEDGATVTLNAAPAPGSAFAGWSGGGCSGTGPCQVTLHGDATVTAVFQLQAPPSGGGGGTPPQPQPKPRPKPLKCKHGFVKKTVHGKSRCVRKKKHRPHH